MVCIPYSPQINANRSGITNSPLNPLNFFCSGSQRGPVDLYFLLLSFRPCVYILIVRFYNVFKWSFTLLRIWVQIGVRDPSQRYEYSCLNIFCKQFQSVKQKSCLTMTFILKLVHLIYYRHLWDVSKENIMFPVIYIFIYF